MPPLAETLTQVTIGVVFFLLFTLLPVLVLCAAVLICAGRHTLRNFGLLVCGVLLVHLACYAGLRIGDVLHADWHQSSVEIDLLSDDGLLAETAAFTFAGYGFIEAPFAALYVPVPEGG